MGLKIPRLVIAGIAGDSGKTLVSLSVVRALRQKQKIVSVFKKGPDYIDAAWLSYVSDTTCRNLDTFLINPDTILSSFITHSSNSDIAIIEGNRGLYDGSDVLGTHSTATLAQIIQAPVILVVNVTKTTRTVAAIIKGLIDFDSRLNIAGVVLNKVAGKRHENILKATIRKYCNIPVVGIIPRLGEESSVIPGRHLGLITPSEYKYRERLGNILSYISDNYLDLSKIISISKKYSTLKENEKLKKSKPTVLKERKEAELKIGYFHDTAFTFYCPENLEALEKAGAVLVPISAIKDRDLPQINGLYIGGGFPETQAQKLTKNRNLMESVKKSAESGMPMYAECGGLIYLSRSISIQGNKFLFSGVFPVDLIMNKKPMGHGYSIVKIDNDNPFYKKNLIINGHEFHYSSVQSFSEKIETCMIVNKGYGVGELNKRKTSLPNRQFRDGFIYKNVLGCYIHTHSLGNKTWARSFVKKAKEFQKKTRIY